MLYVIYDCIKYHGQHYISPPRCFSCNLGTKEERNICYRTEYNRPCMLRVEEQSGAATQGQYLIAGWCDRCKSLVSITKSSQSFAGKICGDIVRLKSHIRQLTQELNDTPLLLQTKDLCGRTASTQHAIILSERIKWERGDLDGYVSGFFYRAKCKLCDEDGQIDRDIYLCTPQQQQWFSKTRAMINAKEDTQKQILEQLYELEKTLNKSVATT